MTDDPERLRARIADLESRLATKEREIAEIHRSRAWAFATAFRSLKHRFVDPVLGAAGIEWPRADDEMAVAPPIDIPAPRPEKYDVVCLAICDWDARTQRPQQLMSRFAAAGHRVFFVRPRLRRSGPPFVATLKRENVYEISLRRGEPLTALPLADARVVVEAPGWWPLARGCGWPVIYDCMDLHGGFRTVRQREVRLEGELLARADVVIVSSAALEGHARRKRSDVLLVRNGCEFDHFARTARARNARPVIGFYGAIAEWFDTALVARLAARRTDWDFVLVGSTYGGDIARLAKLPNVTMPGEQAYASLPDWLGRFDVGIVPFRRTPLTEATNPVKVYEMLAAGKPVVSVPLPEVAALAPLVRLASTPEEFEREITAALAEDDSAAEPRRAFAREQTWEKRFEVMERAVAGAGKR